MMNENRTLIVRPSVKRLPPHERERLILDEAIDFFAEKGFDGLIRDLAERLNISQALIFRYFGSKDELIDRVYESVCFTRWDPSWEDIIKDEGVEIGDRLKRFYKSYIKIADDYRWVRISMYSALTGHDLKRQYVQSYVTGLVTLIAQQVKLWRGLPSGDELSEEEKEEIWQLHSAVVYYSIRKHIHKSPIKMERDVYVDFLIDKFIANNGNENSKREFGPLAAIA